MNIEYVMRKEKKIEEWGKREEKYHEHKGK